MSDTIDTTATLSLSSDLLQIAADTQRRVLGTVVPKWLADTLATAPATRMALVNRVALALGLEADVPLPVSRTYLGYVQCSRSARRRIATRAVLHLIGREVGTAIDACAVRNIQSVIGAENYASALLMADAPESSWRLPRSAADFDAMVQDCHGQWLRTETGEQALLHVFLSDAEQAAITQAPDCPDPDRLTAAFIHVTQGLGADG